ncbi:hypothetical protein [Fodinicola feengrottensis]|uniref:hypothetical protein n=1 Tax=Fodinicola feengrottensis TaxID=435914 RepID=UPI0013D20DD7|nr:hypothetical protein [Fodinicola feengrottensis]
MGSGWGALEVRTRWPARRGRRAAFADDTLGPDQQPWLQLWETGAFPAQTQPVSTNVGPQWTDKLLTLGDDWHALLHLGLLRHSTGDHAGARAAWQKSSALKENPWSLRNLAVVEQDATAAAALLTHAHALLPGNWQLTNETLAALLRAGLASDALDLISGLDSAQRAHGRIRLCECRAALAVGDTQRAGAILRGPWEISDLKEGEDSLGRLWSDYQRAAGTDEPLPYRYDFRMHPEPAPC